MLKYEHHFNCYTITNIISHRINFEGGNKMKDIALIELKDELEHSERRIQYHNIEIEKHRVSLAKYKVKREELKTEIENLEREGTK